MEKPTSYTAKQKTTILEQFNSLDLGPDNYRTPKIPWLFWDSCITWGADRQILTKIRIPEDKSDVINTGTWVSDILDIKHISMQWKTEDDNDDQITPQPTRHTLKLILLLISRELKVPDNVYNYPTKWILAGLLYVLQFVDVTENKAEGQLASISAYLHVSNLKIYKRLRRYSQDRRFSLSRREIDAYLYLRYVEEGDDGNTPLPREMDTPNLYTAILSHCRKACP